MAIVQRELKYAIASDGTNPGSQVDAIISYNDSNPGAGPVFDSYNITAISGTYSTVDSNGNVIRSSGITGLSSYAGADNIVYPSSMPYVDGNGVSFVISNAADSNDGAGNVNFFYGADVNGMQAYQELGSNLNDASSVTFAPVCFVTGTLIRTSRGDVAVEDLRVGDTAVTASGELRPITWIGHRALEAAGKPLPHDQQPIRIRAGAFGHDASGRSVPARDLRLSPGHPVLVGADENSDGGVLVPVMCLINGTSITRETVAAVTYWHVELDAHDILLAEGLPAESYLDWGDRPFFTEGSDHALHNPDFVMPGLSARCRPVAIDGAVVEAEHRRLDGVFAAYLAAQCAWREPAVA